MHVLVVNCGSSSIKYSLFRMTDGEAGDVLASGLVERIGEAESRIHHEVGGTGQDRAVRAPDHQTAFGLMVRQLTEGPGAVISGPDEMDAVGHRAPRHAQAHRVRSPAVLAADGGRRKNRYDAKAYGASHPSTPCVRRAGAGSVGASGRPYRRAAGASIVFRFASEAAAAAASRCASA